MKSVFFMSLFALLMTVAFSNQSVSTLALVAPAYAGSDSDEESNKDDSDSNDIAFNCPAGIATCYRADGSEYTDINNLAATAAGYDEEADDKDKDEDNLAKFVNPRNYRSF